MDFFKCGFFQQRIFFQKWIFSSKVDILDGFGTFQVFSPLEILIYFYSLTLLEIRWRSCPHVCITRWVIMDDFLKKSLNENLHVYIKASAGLTVWKLFHIGGMSEIYQIKYCEVTTKIIKISLYWQILEKSSTIFSEISAFWKTIPFFVRNFNFRGMS